MIPSYIIAKNQHDDNLVTKQKLRQCRFVMSIECLRLHHKNFESFQKISIQIKNLPQFAF